MWTYYGFKKLFALGLGCSIFCSSCWELYLLITITSDGFASVGSLGIVFKVYIVPVVLWLLLSSNVSTLPLMWAALVGLLESWFPGIYYLRTGFEGGLFLPDWGPADCLWVFWLVCWFREVKLRMLRFSPNGITVLCLAESWGFLDSSTSEVLLLLFVFLSSCFWVWARSSLRLWESSGRATFPMFMFSLSIWSIIPSCCGNSFSYSAIKRDKVSLDVRFYVQYCLKIQTRFVVAW